MADTRPLHLAAKNNHLACVRELMLSGADYNAVDSQGRTSMYIAAEMGHEEAVLVHLNNAYGKTILSLPIRDTGTCIFYAVILTRKNRPRYVKVKVNVDLYSASSWEPHL